MTGPEEFADSENEREKDRKSDIETKTQQPHKHRDERRRHHNNFLLQRKLKFELQVQQQVNSTLPRPGQCTQHCVEPCPIQWLRWSCHAQ
jgi:hypothetical protein